MKRPKHPLLMLMAAAIGLLSLAFFSPQVLAGKPVQPPPDPGIRYRIDLFLPGRFYGINNNGQILGCREDSERSDRVGIVYDNLAGTYTDFYQLVQQWPAELDPGVWHLDSGVEINHSGAVCGFLSNAAGQRASRQPRCGDCGLG